MIRFSLLVPLLASLALPAPVVLVLAGLLTACSMWVLWRVIACAVRRYPSGVHKRVTQIHRHPRLVC